MDIRFLDLTEFQRVHFYRFITLAILAAASILALANLPDLSASERFLVAGILLLCWRFAVEWFRVQKSAPAFIHNEELVISGADSHRQIPLRNIRSVSSSHSLFMVRRYRSWSDHLAFLEVTLTSGEPVYTLIESAVFEFPAGKHALAAMQAAVLAAKMKRRDE